MHLRPSRWLRLCAGIAAGFLLAEATVRLAYFGTPSLLQPWRYTPGGGADELFDRVDDPRIRYKLKPSLRTLVKGKPFTTNSAGFRSPEIDHDKPPDVFRIAVLGASSSMGSGVSDDEVYSARLQQRFEDGAHGRVEVMNLAVSGYGLAQMLAAYEAFAAPYRPNAVLVPFYQLSGLLRIGQQREEKETVEIVDFGRQLDPFFAYHVGRAMLSEWLPSQPRSLQWNEFTAMLRGLDELVEPFTSARREEGMTVWFLPLRWRTSPRKNLAFRIRLADTFRRRHDNVRVIDLLDSVPPGALDQIYYGDAHLGPRAHEAIAGEIFATVAGEVAAASVAR